MPYTNDLVRLATSALVAARENHLALASDAACAAILEGYSRTLEQGGCPLVLAERHPWLREVATGNLRAPVSFWEKFDKMPVASDVPPQVIVTTPILAANSSRPIRWEIREANG